MRRTLILSLALVAGLGLEWLVVLIEKAQADRLEFAAGDEAGTRATLGRAPVLE